MRHRVADARDFSPGSGRVVMIGDHAVALFNLNGVFVAMDNRCPHRGGSLGDGTLDGAIVTCPWHGWRIHCLTGEAVDNPAITVRKYAVQVSDGEVWIDWPEEGG